MRWHLSNHKWNDIFFLFSSDWSVFILLTRNDNDVYLLLTNNMTSEIEMKKHKSIVNCRHFGWYHGSSGRWLDTVPCNRWGNLMSCSWFPKAEDIAQHVLDIVSKCWWDKQIKIERSKYLNRTDKLSRYDEESLEWCKESICALCHSIDDKCSYGHIRKSHNDHIEKNHSCHLQIIGRIYINERCRNTCKLILVSRIWPRFFHVRKPNTNKMVIGRMMVNTKFR